MSRSPISIEANIADFRTEPPVKASARIVVSRDAILQLTGKLENDRLCVIEGSGSDGAVVREAVLWYSLEPLKKSLVRVPKAFREASGLSAKAPCRIIVYPDRSTIPEAADVEAEEITIREGLAPLSEPADISFWIDDLEDQLDLTEMVYPGMVVRDIVRRRTRRTFRIKTVNGKTENVARYVIDKTTVRLSGSKVPTITNTTLPIRSRPSSVPTLPSKKQHPSSEMARPRFIQMEPIAGLESAVTAINRFLGRFDPDAQLFGNKTRCASVLQGDEGTGKTLLLKRVTASGWGNVFEIRPNEELAAIVEIFQMAYEQRPSIVTIDNIQKLLAEDRANRNAVIQALCGILDRNYESRAGDGSTDAATVGRPEALQLIVLVTCVDYTKDIPEDLRKPNRLDLVIPVPFPDAAGRQAILRSFNMPLPPDRADAIITHLSQQTHAFNGHDLEKLYQTAYDIAVEQLHQAQLRQRKANGLLDVSSVDADGIQQGQAQQAGQAQTQYLTEEIFKEARKTVGPSRMDGVDVKPRPVHWDDIHGQENLILGLKQRVDMMNNPEQYKDIVNPFPRGYLLYGPPGCSKTMAAQALATESGLNYFSVKGGELLNQYVGETERSVRDLFARARRASPAVIFLDEIDALAGRRANFGDGQASTSRGPQMVPALLSELDGFEPLDKVFVVAATNRPEALDPALLRGGRLDEHYYVPPPSEAARRAIFASWTKAMRVSPDLDLDLLARESDGFSGAEVLRICNQAAKRTMNAGKVNGRFGDITTDAFIAGIRGMPKSITSQMLKHYETWTPSFK